jgi:CodY helix-turn-helix domain
MTPFEKARPKLVKLWNQQPRLTVAVIAARIRTPQGTTVNWLRKLQDEGVISPRNLGPLRREEAVQREIFIRKLRTQGYYFRDIALEIGISQARVQQIFYGS